MTSVVPLVQDNSNSSSNVNLALLRDSPLFQVRPVRLGIEVSSFESVFSISFFDTCL